MYRMYGMRRVHGRTGGRAVQDVRYAVLAVDGLKRRMTGGTIRPQRLSLATGSVSLNKSPCPTCADRGFLFYDLKYYYPGNQSAGISVAR